MKKTLLRSLIVGLFAVVSLNASAQYWPFTVWQPNQVEIGSFWMEPNSVAEFDIDVSDILGPWDYSNVPYSEEAQYYVRYFRLLRVAYYGNTFNLKEGDIAYIYSSYYTEGYATVLNSSTWQFGYYFYDAGCDVYVGTNSPKNDIIPIGPDNVFHVVICSGSVAGERSIGGQGGPILYWRQKLELRGCPIGDYPLSPQERWPFDWHAWENNA